VGRDGMVAQVVENADRLLEEESRLRPAWEGGERIGKGYKGQGPRMGKTRGVNHAKITRNCQERGVRGRKRVGQSS